MASKFIHIVGVFALGMILSACSPTKFMDTEESAAADDAQGTVSAYDPEVASDSERLYGDEDNLAEESPKLKEATKVEPLLIYNIVYFSYDSDDVTASATDVLKRHADYLGSNDGVRFILEGHTDKRGSTGYNQALGTRRAQAVKNLLVSLGAPPDRLEVKSYGEERPAVEREDEDAFSKNRRVEIIYK